MKNGFKLSKKTLEWAKMRDGYLQNYLADPDLASLAGFLMASASFAHYVIQEGICNAKTRAKIIPAKGKK